MTDGAKQHFKNKFQISNLIKHKEDFNFEAEWHFSATAHGKSAYDGIGATFKRAAYKQCLTGRFIWVVTLSESSEFEHKIIF